jgi:hypothetical protein
MADRTREVPSLAGEYVTVYQPGGDRYDGPDTPELHAGQWYDEWVPNDHAVLKGPDGRWHAFGITHPLTSPAGIHEGEFQSFHAVAPAGPLAAALVAGSWEERPKVLPPAERPGEILENHAPCIVLRDGLYHMLYGPSPLRLAVSEDLCGWTPQGALFAENDGARDPCVLLWEGLYHLVYCSLDRVRLRTSPDLRTWGEARTVLRLPEGIAPESPCLVRHGEGFTLFVCGWDGVWDEQDVAGAYQHVTYVYQSATLTCFEGPPVTQLPSHAPEVFQGEGAEWYISSVEWPRRGLSLAPLAWR